MVRDLCREERPYSHGSGWSYWLRFGIVFLFTLGTLVVCMSGWVIEGPRRLLRRGTRTNPPGRKAGATVLAIGIGVLLAMLAVLPATAASEDLAFRIISVSTHDNQLLVEVEHFKTDGSFDYFENYLWQGREGLKEPRMVNSQGDLYLSDGSIAPYRVLDEGRRQYYRPDGRGWLRTGTPHLDHESVLTSISLIHKERETWDNDDWPGGYKRGQSRLLEKPVAFNQRDAAGIEKLISKFHGMGATGYGVDNDGNAQTYDGELPEVNPGLGLIEYGTVSTFYPDADGVVDQTSADGQANFSYGGGAGASWSTIRGQNGDAASDSNDQFNISVTAVASTDDYSLLSRGFFLFDTSDLPAADIISAAVFSLTLGAKIDDFSDSMALVQSTTGSNTAIVAADFQGTVGNVTKQAPSLTIASLTANNSTYNDWTLNSTGRGNINQSGITKLGIRSEFDLADSPTPTWGSGKKSRITPNSAEEVQSGDVRPKLVVTHAAPSAAVTGTVGDGATEQEVRDGNGTIILTLTGTEWVADGATFNAQRQNIIDGLDSAQSETYGWNAEVRDQIGVSSVIRTSATIATITLTASEVEDYRITSDETITVTVPASANTASAAITATPTFTISAATEGVALTGTLQAGVTSPTIVAGGKTLILTLTNTKWVADGATFNAQRQGIINGITSSKSDQNGWDNQKSNLPVGDVVRTSDTIVTVELSALSGYAIPEAEVLTATAPAAAVVYGVTLTAAATATITPNFVASGTWVSPAIDLNSISSLSYCAIGWSATTPANTAVTGSYSTDGGSNYSAATNGSCPFDAGSDQSGVTDLRVRLTLSATSSTDTPLVTALGVIVGDTAGQTVRYQLNDTPALTITDRTGNGYGGTMSFPAQPSGVSTTVGSMTAIRSAPSAQTALGVPQVTSPVTGAAVSPNLFTLDETGWAALPGYAVINSMSTAGDGLPIQFVWYIFLGFFIIMAGFFALNLTQSLFAAAVTMALGIGAALAIGGGLLPGWVIFVFIPIATGLIFLRPRLAI
jgi:hypothetical protein